MNKQTRQLFVICSKLDSIRLLAESCWTTVAFRVRIELDTTLQSRRRLTRNARMSIRIGSNRKLEEERSCSTTRTRNLFFLRHTGSLQIQTKHFLANTAADLTRALHHTADVTPTQVPYAYKFFFLSTRIRKR